MEIYVKAMFQSSFVKDDGCVNWCHPYRNSMPWTLIHGKSVKHTHPVHVVHDRNTLACARLNTMHDCKQHNIPKDLKGSVLSGLSGSVLFRSEEVEPVGEKYIPCTCTSSCVCMCMCIFV